MEKLASVSKRLQFDQQQQPQQQQQPGEEVHDDVIILRNRAVQSQVSNSNLRDLELTSIPIILRALLL